MAYPRIYSNFDPDDSRPHSYLKEQGAIVLGLRINTDTLQRELAQALEVKRQTISAIETGQRDITLQEGFAIAAFFSVDIYTLEVGGCEAGKAIAIVDDTPRPARRATEYTKAQGLKLRQIRTDRRLHVTKIASVLGTVNWVVYSIENGSRSLYLQEGFRLARAIGFDVGELRV